MGEDVYCRGVKFNCDVFLLMIMRKFCCWVLLMMVVVLGFFGIIVKYIMFFCFVIEMKVFFIGNFIFILFLKIRVMVGIMRVLVFMVL